MDFYPNILRFLFFALFLRGTYSCDCKALSNCLAKALRPCTGLDPRISKDLLWITQLPDLSVKTRCSRTWNTIRFWDTEFSFLDRIFNCQSGLQVCHASVNMTIPEELSEKMASVPKQCFAAATQCHVRYSTNCLEYDHDEVWRLCWMENKEISSNLWELLQKAWECEADRDIRKEFGGQFAAFLF